MAPASDCILLKSVCFQHIQLCLLLISFQLNIYLFLNICCLGQEFGLICDMAFENPTEGKKINTLCLLPVTVFLSSFFFRASWTIKIFAFASRRRKITPCSASYNRGTISSRKPRYVWDFLLSFLRAIVHHQVLHLCVLNYFGGTLGLMQDDQTLIIQCRKTRPISLSG